MERYENVRSTAKPEPVKIDDFSVYVSTDIAERSIVDESGISRIEYEYDLSRYTKDEYIHLMSVTQMSAISNLSDTIDTLLINILEGGE